MHVSTETTSGRQNNVIPEELYCFVTFDIKTSVVFSNVLCFFKFTNYVI